ncbi:hypothetical protein IH992_13665 [Candidatus Poribacteria bacterium]|nr:hypothetical protein [Candidatus Poribacteria bacterium]
MNFILLKHYLITVSRENVRHLATIDHAGTRYIDHTPLLLAIGSVAVIARFLALGMEQRKLTFDHARWQEIEEYQLQSVLVHRGELLVRAVHNAAQTAKSSQPSARISIRDSQLSSELPSTSARTANRLPTSAISNRTERRTKRRMVYTVHRVKQLFVNRLDFVKAGQPIAEVYRKHNPQDTTLLRLRLATEKKLLALARQQIDANIRLIDDDSSAFRKAYEKLNIQGSVFSNHSAKAQQLWKKIHKLASNKAQLRQKRGFSCPCHAG